MVDSRATFLAGVAALVVAAGGGIYAYKARYKPPPVDIPPVADVAGLPRVLIIGDSISMGYAPHVRNALRGIANIHQPPTNAKSTAFTLKHLDHFLGSGRWDAIYFNFGLHDLAHELVAPDTFSDRIQVPPDQYRTNLTRITKRLKQTGARLVFATTTAVPADAPGRAKDGQAPYNAIARGVMQKLGVPVDPLDTVEAGQPPADVHFTEDGYKALGAHVAKTIRSQL